MPSSSSARAKCIISRSAATDGDDDSRWQTPATSAGRKPSRFMPVLTLTNTSSGRDSADLFEHPHLLDVMHDRGEPSQRELGQFAFGEEALEHQDAPRVPALAQFDRDVRLDQREPVGVLERRQDAQQAVPVGVGLDDREHLRARRLARGRVRGSPAARRG